ncbi:hypothetical protein [Mycolicibacterium mageritense]|uniref:hypothetical protein n=1 Tax=Mycolicibacterium mageritense TaxID=53462 RepID=UPI0011D5317E|nr:hypothetical protein [Mycolicibacterium mageritense]TXI56245.1 MAG: hypothetical protein E6Q55_29630 [Mycolicibacterium mageritense]
MTATKVVDQTPVDPPEPPAGASIGGNWEVIPEGYPDAGRVFRAIDWPGRWSEDRTAVAGVTGSQFADGGVYRFISLNIDDVTGKEISIDITDRMALNIISVLCPAITDWWKSR